MPRNKGKKIVAKLTEHPLEDVLNITPGSTLIQYEEPLPAVPPVDHLTYDEKDKEVEQRFEEIYNTAMDQADELMGEMKQVEGKYKARVGEVARRMLNVALGAAKEKSAQKMHKDKMGQQRQPTPSTVNNTAVFVDRNEFLRLAREAKKKQQP